MFSLLVKCPAVLASHLTFTLAQEDHGRTWDCVRACPAG